MAGHGGKEAESPTELTEVEKCRGFCRGGCRWERHRRPHRAGMGRSGTQDPTGLARSKRGAEDFAVLWYISPRKLC